MTKIKYKKYWYGKYFDFISFQYWREYYKKNFKKRAIIICVFLLNNGKYDMVTVTDEDGKFFYKNNLYVIDTSCMREDVNTNLNMLFYHESVCLPVKLSIDLKELNKVIEKSSHADIISSLNPVALKSFIKSEVIKQLVSARDVLNKINSMMMFLYIILGVGGISLYLILKMGGYIG
jgi:hypothetical protein